MEQLHNEEFSLNFDKNGNPINTKINEEYIDVPAIDPQLTNNVDVSLVESLQSQIDELTKLVNQLLKK